MTTFATEKQIRDQTNVDDLNEYDELKNKSDKLVKDAEEWLANGTAFHQSLSDADKKVEVLALRTDLIQRLKTALGL